MWILEFGLRNNRTTYRTSRQIIYFLGKVMAVNMSFPWTMNLQRGSGISFKKDLSSVV